MKSIVNKFLGSRILLEPITLGGAALVAGGTALANWLFNKEQNSSNVGKSKELMDYQVQKQQQYQRWLSAMQYPSMIASLRSAGLNPNLALGGTPSQMQASAPSATTGQQATKVDVLGAAQSIKEMELLDAEKNLKESEAKKNQAQAAESWANTDLLDQRVLTGLQTWAQEMAESKSRVAVNDAQVKQFEQSVKTLAAQEDELISKIDLNKSFTKYNDKQIAQFDDLMRATIREKLASANYLNASAKTELETLLYKQFNYSAMTNYYNTGAGVNRSQESLNYAQRGLSEVNTKAQEISNKYNLRYGDVERVVGIVTDVVGTAAQCTSAGGMLMMGLKGFSPKQGRTAENYTPMPGGAWTKTTIWNSR